MRIKVLEVRLPREEYAERILKFFLSKPLPPSHFQINDPCAFLTGMIMASPPCTGPAEKADLLWLRC